MEKPEYLRLIMIALQWYQHIYGVSYPLLAIKKLFAEYGNSKWLNHFIKLLRKYNAHIKLKTFDLPITQRLHNIYIMDILTRNISSKTTLQRLNACRLFLQVTLLSKIGTTNGKDIQNNILKGKRKSIESNKHWPRQKFPDIATWKMWKSILKKNFFSYKNHLQSKFQLGSWDYLPSQLARKYTFLYISALNEIYQRQGKTIVNWFANEKRRTTITHNVDSQDTVPSIPVDAHPINFILDDSFYIMRNPNFTPTNNKPSSLIDFIQSKPVWERTLIDHFQDNTNVESLLQCLTNRSDLLIASDGSKIRTKSGGGWVIATKN